MGISYGVSFPKSNFCYYHLFLKSNIERAAVNAMSGFVLQE